MTYKEFKLLDKIVKDTKTDQFVITPSLIVGTDAYSVTLTFCHLSTQVDKVYEFTKNIWTDMVKTIEASANKETLDYNKVMDKLYSIKRVGDVSYISKYHEMINLINTVTPTLIIEDLKSDPDFVDIMAKKADEGASFYKPSENFIMSLFKSLIPLVKKDKAGLTLYEVTGGKQFIARAIINKGYTVIEKYIRYNKV